MGTRSTREATAYHEAGHAVAAAALGLSVGRCGISIVPSEEHHGFVHIPIPISGNVDAGRSGAARLRAEKRAIIDLAGEAAQRHYRPNSLRRYHGGQDRDNAADLLSYFVRSDRELQAWLNLLAIRARDLITSEPWWSAVEAVAATLLERNTLSGKDAASIIRRALG